MKERALLNIWGRVNARWHRFMIGLWIALGVEIACGVLLLAQIIPVWAWALSWIPWFCIFFPCLTFDWFVGIIRKEYEETK